MTKKLKVRIRGKRMLSIQPLHGSHDEWIETLVAMREHIESYRVTKGDIKSWYLVQHGTTREVATPYINSLFASGLLGIERDHVVACFPRSKNRNKKIIKIIDKNVKFIVDMMNEVRAGNDDYNRLLSVGRRKYGLAKSTPRWQIWARSGWLCSAGMMERRNRRLRVTKEGERLLEDERIDVLDEIKVNPAEFGGVHDGEGEEHQTLKQWVFKNCSRVVDGDVDDAEKEYLLRSGDRVDVAAWTEERVWYLEVKSKISQNQDVERGVLQCVKYASVGRAMEILGDSPRRDVRSILVVERNVSSDLARAARRLRVPVCTLTKSMRRELESMRTKAKRSGRRGGAGRG